MEDAEKRGDGVDSMEGRQQGGCSVGGSLHINISFYIISLITPLYKHQ